MPTLRPRHSLILVASIALAASGIIYGCRDESRPTAPNSRLDVRALVNLTLIKLAYSCGNVFKVRNSNQEPVTVDYQVQGFAEQGTLNLPAPAEGKTFSEVFLTAKNRGTVTLSYAGQPFTSANNGNKGCNVNYTKGSWAATITWPVVSIHAALLPDGKVLTWQRKEFGGSPTIWDPTTGSFSSIPIQADIFCSGHTLLPDGRLIVTGGHISSNTGLNDVHFFDYATQSWTPGSFMRAGRWYPTNTTLPNGEILTLSGGDENAQLNLIPEVMDVGGAWRNLSNATIALPYYPWMFVAPDGRVFYAGSGQATGFLDPAGSGAWAPGPPSSLSLRSYGSAVMYEPGKVLIVGGGDPPTKRVEVIDLNGAAMWRTVKPLPTARRQHNATILPDGRVLVTGGTSGPGFNNASGSQLATLVWNPATEAWTTLGSMKVRRLYHSTALLLPDGRVLSTGSGQPSATGQTDQYNAEIYSPSYLFKPLGGPANRPVIASAPTSVTYSESFQVNSPNASEIASVTLVRLGSVTHSFNQNQRFMRLGFTAVTGALTVTAPANANLAPPGHYMLFLVDANGVPSVAAIVQIR